MPRNDNNDRDVYVYETDSRGRQQVYRVETVTTWYCYYCSHGPMSHDLDEHCTDCRHRRSPYSYVDTRTYYHIVRR
ncbi:hypothetical protein N0V93_009025 [Gnomoniopsis smithogilvyi]|uniref:Uncharacterized protein n=1 Tax=Gnomoniopsis smithogilvyi TaxID=1191159 RepID=A0A9W8YL83_9PEZI|nr:hypothetical protein N0V93_009025 [Gnomoniopsis smithogilvyi]